MSYCQHKILFVMSLAMLLLVSGLAVGTITQINTSPSSANLPLGRSASVRLTWSVVSDLAEKVTVSSSQGIFLAPDGKVLGMVDKVLTRLSSGPAPNSVRFNETLLVPARVIYQASKQGYGKIIYRRSFTDGALSTKEITLYITSPKAAGFSLSRIVLRFDTETLLQQVKRDEALQVRAQLAFVGTGLFKAVWEIADPGSTAGPADFRPLQKVRQYMTGSETVTLESPLLPTKNSGLYLVRLTISKPAIAFELPVIRYWVGVAEQQEAENETD